MWSNSIIWQHENTKVEKSRQSQKHDKATLKMQWYDWNRMFFFAVPLWYVLALLSCFDGSHIIISYFVGIPRQHNTQKTWKHRSLVNQLVCNSPFPSKRRPLILRLFLLSLKMETLTEQSRCWNNKMKSRGKNYDKTKHYSLKSKGR